MYIPQVVSPSSLGVENGTDMKNRRVKWSWWMHWAVLVYFTCEYGCLKYCICLLQMEQEAQNTLLNETLPVHVNSSSFIASPLLTVCLRQSKWAQRGSDDSLQWLTAEFSASPSYEHLASAVVLLFYSQLSCDDKQGEWKVNALTPNDLQRLLTNQWPALQNGAKHFCHMGKNCGFYLWLFPEK